MLTLKNPHSVLAALKSRPGDVERVTVPGNLPPEDPWGKVAALARQKGVRVQGPSRDDRREAARGANSRGIRGPGEDGRLGASEAQVREREGLSAEALFADAATRAGGKGLWLALDCLTDPHNVGAIFRTAAFFGVQGILVTQDRSAPLTGTVYDIACGGVDTVPFTLQTNLQHALEIAKENGLWILGTSEHANDNLLKIQRDRPWLLVLGNEEKGMRRLTQESCDLLCSIPAKSEGVTSLNVSVAAGIAIAHLS